jgi:hypothetical protein
MQALIFIIFCLYLLCFNARKCEKERKNHAFNPRYENPLQDTLSGFEHLALSKSSEHISYMLET